ncbi:MAG: DUF59 domain-containing protein [Myxococcales bacterium]|nr:DUF59 domain-containing protein [Myxococcales bacterium]
MSDNLTPETTELPIDSSVGEAEQVEVVESEATAAEADQPGATAGDSEVDGESVTDAQIIDGVIDTIRTIFDPEIPVNIYELGLIYNVELEGSHIHVDMTLTSPACPVAGSLPPEVQYKISQVPGVESCKVDVVWDPPWTPDMMTEAAKLELNMW